MDRTLTRQPRLRAIADLVPPGSRLADVGTDHGYIPAALLLEGHIAEAIASDIGREPLEHAARTARQWGVADRMELRLCDGLSAIAPDEADTVVIAGMGGDNIVDILSAAPWTREGILLLLQPMSRPETLRRWLPENGYAVTAEELVLDKGTIYPILSVRGGHMPPATDGEAYGGFLLGEDPLWGPYLEDRILRLRKAAAGLARARDEGLAQRREMFLAAAAALSEKKGEWERAHRT